MAKLYFGFKRWQWAVILAMVSVNTYLTSDDLLDPWTIGSAIIVLVPLYYVVSRVVVGIYRYLKYEYWDDPIYRSPNKINRERKYFTLVIYVVILLVLSASVGFAFTYFQDVDSDNPYGQKTLVVGMDGSAMEEDKEDEVKNALQYWEENNRSERYAGYPIQYEFKPNAKDPDVVVRWVDDIEKCGPHDATDAVGCAPLILEQYDIPEPVVIHVESGQPKRERTETLKHELGHTLGLEHDDEPQEVMSIENRTQQKS